ncbi:MAG: glutamate-1-semialdehyde 2,1-aminomutase [Candidatus Methanoplasma sp.]|jgi:glutamate-1-semialdehyde 2,1-aminomutase|nr:glutamate-1-semialdehyde 2,1-aminomutase [Candidatus Methanoplasma sp.]
MNREASFRHYQGMKALTPGGVSSPVRAFEPSPVFISSGKGCVITDEDGNGYVDLCMAYGPLILGHSHPSVVSAVKKQMNNGTVFGAPSVREMELIAEISKRVPCAEMVRLVNSGTEATMHALRLARGYTGRRGVVKMKGGFHGSHDALLSDISQRPSGNGILRETASFTHAVEYNSEEDVESILEKNDDIAAVIMEPVLGNAGVVPPKKDYLRNVRKITKNEGILLIFDEVITGFRLSAGGAQEFYGVTPDLCTMGKIMGGGFPAGALAGKRDIMQLLSPAGPVYQAGTFSGNPVTAAAGTAALREMTNEKYEYLNRMSSELVSSISDSLEDNGIPATVNAVGSMFQVFFGPGPVNNGTDASGCNRKVFADLFRNMLDSGVYLPPSALEVNFLSTEHGPELGKLSEAFGTNLRRIA